MVYDLHNNASFRLIEPLLYRSRFYDPSLQTIMLSLISTDERPFVLSTPRFHEPGNVHLRTPFASEQVDFLFGLKQKPACFAQIKDKVGFADGDDQVFRSFLTYYRKLRGSTLLEITVLFEYTTVRSLAQHLAGGNVSSAMQEAHQRAQKQQSAWVKFKPSRA